MNQSLVDTIAHSGPGPMNFQHILRKHGWSSRFILLAPQQNGRFALRCIICPSTSANNRLMGQHVNEGIVFFLNFVADVRAVFNPLLLQYYGNCENIQDIFESNNRKIMPERLKWTLRIDYQWRSVTIVHDANYIYGRNGVPAVEAERCLRELVEICQLYSEK